MAQFANHEILLVDIPNQQIITAKKFAAFSGQPFKLPAPHREQ